MSIRQTLEKVILEHMTAAAGRTSLDPDENLLAEGIVDSLGLMKLIDSMEESFGIEVGDDDILPENFQSISVMAEFVERKIQEK